MDLWCEPEERGNAVEALMGELSWYHERHGAYVEVWRPETFAAPVEWRSRARVQSPELQPDVTVAKLERLDPQDLDHVRRILEEFPVSEERFQMLVAESPYRRGLIDDQERVDRFQYGLDRLSRLIAA